MESSLGIISVVFLSAVFLGVFFEKIRLPALLGYILVGILVKFFVDGGDWTTFASWGSVFLFFLIGLEMHLEDFVQIRSTIGFLSMFQILVIGGINFVILGLAGVSGFMGIVLAVSLTFSSTILAVTNLSRRKGISSLTGRLIVGTLIVQDVVAIVLMTLVGARGGVVVLVRGVVLALGFLILSTGTVPKIVRRLKLSSEELVLASLAWCLLVAAVFSTEFVGLSVEIGAFMAGLAMSTSFENHHIAVKVRTLRDFFVVLFFVNLGMSINWRSDVVFNGLVLGVVLVLLKVVLVWVALRIGKYTNRLALDVGLSLSSSSEFALIIVVLASTLGFLDQKVTVLISIAIICSMGLGSLVQSRLDWIYSVWGRRLVSRKEETEWPDDNFVLLVGCNRMGSSILTLFLGQKRKMVVLDHDPIIIRKLKERGVDARYTDVADVQTLEGIPFDKVTMVVSTVGVLEDNLALVKEIKKINKKAKLIVDAETLEDANKLYKAGADYTVFPHFVGGLHLAEILDGDEDLIFKYRERQKRLLEKTFGR